MLIICVVGQRLSTQKGEVGDLVGAMKAGERAELNSDDEDED
jgi:hypothetical protein